jgi:hypothetical protein
MAHNKSWLPGGRADILTFSNNWIYQITTWGELWQIPETVLAELKKLVKAAEQAVFIAQAGDRNPGNTAKCNEAFSALVALLRDIKDRYYKQPPLKNSDLVNLSLRPKDKVRTAVMTPTGVASGKVELTVAHQLTVVWELIEITVADPRADHGVRIYMSVVADNPETHSGVTGRHYYLAKPPTNPEQLHESEFTRRKKHTFEFAYEDSGKTAYADFSPMCPRGKPERQERAVGRAV